MSLTDKLQAKLSDPWPIQFEEEQLISLRDIGRKNHRAKVCHLARIAADFLIRLTDLNGGQVPMLDQVRLQRAMRRRAKRDSRKAQ